MKPPPILNLIEWSDTYRKVASKTSALPGQWRTSAQPVAYGPMSAVCEEDTHTISVMAGTQVLKTELLINIAGFYIHQDPGPILFVQPTQAAAEAFSKERFQPTVDVMPELHRLIPRARSRDSLTTISHKPYPGGSLDFVGSNAPGDLASRPKRIALFDEIDKYPPSAGDEGDPVALGEERLSTYKAVGRSKSIRTCSPTVEGESRIGREYAASDRRKCFVPCPHCDEPQVLSWSQVVWSKDEAGGHLPETAAILCGACGSHWSESDRKRALGALKSEPGYGWRQTRPFTCCGEVQEPSTWDDAGRSLCRQCGQRAPYDGHAGFQASKLYSARHRLSDIVREFLIAKGDPELLKKFTNTALAELWKAAGRETLDGSGLIARAEAYGPEDLPNEVLVVTAFCDVQGDRLEVQAIGWGQDEECWPFLYEVINQDPAQPKAWEELDALALRTFKRRDGRVLRIAAIGIDTGGHHSSQVYDYCRKRQGRRVFATKGAAGKRPLWPMRASRSKSNDPVWILGVDAGKDAIYARLKIARSDEDGPRPGFIHFPAAEGFGPDYFDQLTVERRETRRRAGVEYTFWHCPDGRRNEALDTFVGALAVRRSLPRRIEREIEYSIPLQSRPDAELAAIEPAKPLGPIIRQADLAPKKRTLASMLAR